MTKFTAVHGTWHRTAPWAIPGSPFVQFMAECGLELLCPKDPFRWSGDVNGWQFWRRWGFGSKDGDTRDWFASGDALRWYLRPYPVKDRGCILHSHGLWAGICAAAGGLEIPWIVSVGSPCRNDMEAVIQSALPNIGAWLHIYDLRRDWWGFGGGFGDGEVRLERAQRYAGFQNHEGRVRYFHRLQASLGGNDAIIGISHSRVLTHASHFQYWNVRRWTDFMKAGSAATL